MHIAIIIFIALALAITYFFVIYKGSNIKDAFLKVTVVLRPIIIGAIIAYILKSTANGYERLLLRKVIKVEKRGEFKSRRLANIIAVILTYVTWTVAISIILWIVLPQIIESISKFVQDMIKYAPDYFKTLTGFVNEFKSEHPQIAPTVDKLWDSLMDWLNNSLPDQLPELGGSLITGVFGILSFFKDFAVGVVFSVFFLAGRKIFAAKSKLLVHAIFKKEQTANAVISEFRFADRMFGGFLEGKIIDSSIIAIIYYITLEIMDIKYPGLHAVICLVTNIIPFFGPIIGAIPSGIIILMSHSDHPIKVVYFIIFVCVIQFLDGNILDPHIVGGHIKLSPFCVIFAVIVFGGLWGFPGMIIGVPLFAVIYDIVKKLINQRLSKLGKFELIEEHLGKFKDPTPPKKSKKVHKLFKGKKHSDKKENGTDAKDAATDSEGSDE